MAVSRPLLSSRKLKRVSELLDYSFLAWTDSITHAIFDIDGTLTDEHSVTSDRTVDALLALSEVMPIAIATGRFFTSAKLLTDRGPIPAWHICANGATTSKGHDLVATELLDPDFVDQALAVGEQAGLINLLFTLDEVYYGMDEADATPVMKNASEGGHVNFTDLATVDRSQIIKVGYAGEAEQLDEMDGFIRSHYPTVVRGHAQFFDLVRPGVTKWTGLSHFYEETGLDPATGLGIGDTDGDADWLSRIGYPVAAAISTEMVREVSRFQLPDIEDPVAHLLEAIVARR